MGLYHRQAGHSEKEPMAELTFPDFMAPKAAHYAQSYETSPAPAPVASPALALTPVAEQLAITVERGRARTGAIHARANYAATTSAWSAWILTVMAVVIVGWIAFLVVNWQLVHYTYCEQAAKREFVEAHDYRARHCENQNVAAVVRAERSAHADCIDAAKVIVHGADVSKWNCFLSIHMTGIGMCSSFEFCRQVIHWIDTFMMHFSLLLWCVLLFLVSTIIYRVRNIVVSSFNTAMRYTKSYYDSAADMMPTRDPVAKAGAAGDDTYDDDM
jgi:hypothetical protein